MKKTKQSNDQFYLEPVKKITRAAVKKYTRDDLYKEYLNLYEMVTILQESYSKVLKDEWREAADNTKLKDKIEQLEKEIEALKASNNNDKVKNERGAGRKSKFTQEQIQKIYLRRSEGKSFRAIAEEFNCSVGLVHKLIKERDTDWRNYGIEDLKQRIHIREMYIDGFIKTGDTYKEYLEMKARLKELEEAEQNKDK